MLLNKIFVSNFKSFKQLEIKFSKFNIFIGGNASGKSNFIQVIKFYHDVLSFGLDNAVSLQGGVDYLRNIKLDISEKTKYSISFLNDEDKSYRSVFTPNNEEIAIMLNSIDHNFEIQYSKKGDSFKISHEVLEINYKLYSLNKVKGQSKKAISEESMGYLTLIIERTSKGVKHKIIKPESVNLDENEIYPKYFATLIKQEDCYLLTSLLFFFVSPRVNDLSNQFALYDFDPKILKKASSISGKLELEENGTNIAIVLKNIIENSEKKRRFSNILKELLPFIHDLKIDKFVDKSVLFKISEEYSKKIYFPSSLLSDGTVNITALIVALFFQNKSYIVLEEPEKNIHPHLISKLINLMEEASEKTQIIVTTHNPEVVRNADINNIFIVSKCFEGFSTIKRPNDYVEIKTFLDNEIGIADLFVQNLLEV